MAHDSATTISPPVLDRQKILDEIAQHVLQQPGFTEYVARSAQATKHLNSATLQNFFKENAPGEPAPWVAQQPLRAKTLSSQMLCWTGTHS